MNSQHNFTFTMSQPQSLSLSRLDNTVLQPQAADLNARRSISDSVLQRGLIRNYNNQNTIFMLATRSGGRAVRKMISDIEARCDLKMKASPDSQIAPPEEECCILAQWASDSYYGIVIAGKNGIPAIVRAMKVFSGHRGMQECGCLALGNLCCSSAVNLIHTENAGGVGQIINAMRNHPNSVAVQSAACDALRNMSSLILAHAQSETSAVASELIEVLSNCKQMILRPSQSRIADSLLTTLQAQRPSYVQG